MVVKISENCELIQREFDNLKDFRIEELGYFLIRVNDDKTGIEIGLCKNDKPGEIILQIKGKIPQEVIHGLKDYLEINKITLLPEHLMYIGKEVQKAYIAMKQNLSYIQDEELNF